MYCRTVGRSESGRPLAFEKGRFPHPHAHNQRTATAAAPTPLTRPSDMQSPSPDADADAPSELLAPLLEEWRDVFVMQLLSRLDPTDCAILAQVGKPWWHVVVKNKVPRAGKRRKGCGVKLILRDFVGSVQRLAWARSNGCPW